MITRTRPWGRAVVVPVVAFDSDRVHRAAPLRASEAEFIATLAKHGRLHECECGHLSAFHRPHQGSPQERLGGLRAEVLQCQVCECIREVDPDGFDVQLALERIERAPARAREALARCVVGWLVWTAIAVVFGAWWL